MESHENKCYKNPDNKTCVTCSNQLYDREGIYCSRGCKIGTINVFLEQLQEKLIVQGAYVQNVRPLFHCPNWNRDVEQAEIGDYLNEIRLKIELAAMYREHANAPLNGLPF